MSRRIFAAFSAALFLTIAVACSGTGGNTGAPPAVEPVDDLAVFVQRYGQPDRTDTTEFDDPQPLFVTKFLFYDREQVRVAYGLERRDHTWKLLGFQHPRTNAVIEPAEVVRRMAGRESKR